MANPMNMFVLTKMLGYLSSKEGITVVSIKERDSSTEVVVRDTFGFQYTLEITPTTRIDNDPNDFEVIEKLASGSYLSVSKIN